MLKILKWKDLVSSASGAPSPLSLAAMEILYVTDIAYNK